MFNKKNNNDMISLINFPILIETHKHPLIFCSTKRIDGWSCDKCSSSNKCSTPSFYCTYCDYDLCQNCLGNHRLNEIKRYKRNLSNFSNIKQDGEKSFNWQISFPNHNHLLSLLKKENNCIWKCSNCKKEYKNNNIFSYYCSLCDYNICELCNNKIKNIDRAMNIIKKENSSEISSTCCESICCESSYGDDAISVGQKKSTPTPINKFRNKPVEKSFKKPCIKTATRKPVIYLYPEKEMDISVQLDIDLTKHKFTTIYPKFNKENNAWNVHAKPNGDIQLNNKNDKIYPYLYWEADSYLTEDMNEGFIINEENAESFLEEKLKILGLNYKESTDFITYWLPVLLKNKLSLCSFQSKKYFNEKKLIVTPKPDTMIRIFLCIKKIEDPISIKEQKLDKNERKGFTVIEWGGSNF